MLEILLLWSQSKTSGYCLEEFVHALTFRLVFGETAVVGDLGDDKTKSRGWSFEGYLLPRSAAQTLGSAARVSYIDFLAVVIPAELEARVLVPIVLDELSRLICCERLLHV